MFYRLFSGWTPESSFKDIFVQGYLFVQSLPIFLIVISSDLALFELKMNSNQLR